MKAARIVFAFTLPFLSTLDPVNGVAHAAALPQPHAEPLYLRHHPKFVKREPANDTATETTSTVTVYTTIGGLGSFFSSSFQPPTTEPPKSESPTTEPPTTEPRPTLEFKSTGPDDTGNANPPIDLTTSYPVETGGTTPTQDISVPPTTPLGSESPSVTTTQTYPTITDEPGTTVGEGLTATPETPLLSVSLDLPLPGLDQTTTATTTAIDPIVQPIEPTTTTAKDPIVQPTEPATTTAKDPTVQPTEPADQTDKPTEPATTAAKDPTVQPTEPVDTDKLREPATTTTKDQTVQPTEPADQTDKPTERMTTTAKDPTVQSTESADQTDKPTEPTTTTAKDPTVQPTESADQTNKPTDTKGGIEIGIGKPTDTKEQTIKPTDTQVGSKTIETSTFDTKTTASSSSTSDDSLILPIQTLDLPTSISVSVPLPLPTAHNTNSSDTHSSVTYETTTVAQTDKPTKVRETGMTTITTELPTTNDNGGFLLPTLTVPSVSVPIGGPGNSTTKVDTAAPTDARTQPPTKHATSLPTNGTENPIITVPTLTVPTVLPPGDATLPGNVTSTYPPTRTGTITNPTNTHSAGNDTVALPKPQISTPTTTPTNMHIPVSGNSTISTTSLPPTLTTSLPPTIITSLPPTITSHTHFHHKNGTMAVPATKSDTFAGSATATTAKPAVTATSHPTTTAQVYSTVIRSKGRITETSAVIPTTLVTQSSIIYTPNPAAPSTTETSLPTSLPKIITPNTGLPRQPDNSLLIQIAFDYGFNYPFVVERPIAVLQIFDYLPKGLAYGLEIPVDQVVMHHLQPYDSRDTVGFIRTLAYCFIPRDLLSRLQADISTPASRLYNNPDQPVAMMMDMIDPSFPLLGFPGSEGSGNNMPGKGGSGWLNSGNNPSPNNNNDGAPLGAQDNENKPMVGKSLGIGLGVVFGAALYGGAMFIVARRYRNRRHRHTRASSISRSTSPGSNPAGALMGGAGGTEAEKRGSNGSGGIAGRTSARGQTISAPMQAENSLGWN